MDWWLIYSASSLDHVWGKGQLFLDQYVLAPNMAKKWATTSELSPASLPCEFSLLFGGRKKNHQRVQRSSYQVETGKNIWYFTPCLFFQTTRTTAGTERTVRLTTARTRIHTGCCHQAANTGTTLQRQWGEKNEIKDLDKQQRNV